MKLMAFVICEQLCQLPFVNNPGGWMAIFDDDASKSWDEKIYTRDEIVDGKTIHYIGL